MKFKELFFNEDWSFNWEKIEKIPQFDKLKATKQSAVWHQEGNAYLHSLLTVQEMHDILRDNKIEEGSENWIMCMMAALCHDLGKVETTKWSEEKQDWTTKNHGVVGERITRNLFYDEDIIQREKVCYMVRHHMALHHVFDEDGEAKRKLVKLSHGIVPIRYMLYLNVADSKGSLNDIETEEKINTKYYKISAYASVLNCFDKPYLYIAKDQLIRDFIEDDSELVNKTTDFCVYILCGFPGCGKSTYVDWFLSDKPVLSRDNIRCELGIGGAAFENNKKVVGTKAEENEVSEIFNSRMIGFCEEKISFVIDNTNLKYQYRKDYLLKIMKYNPKVKIIYIEAPDFINDCVKRREGQIDISVYDRMNNNFDFPQLYECDELVIYKEHKDNENETFTFTSNESPQTLPIETRILNDLRVTRGAMILDGYDCYDSCIKYMDDLIQKYEKTDFDEDTFKIGNGCTN
jgi:predicted kinase